MEMLGVSRPQLYRLRTAWLLSGKKKAIVLGVTGGDHSTDWPKDCVDHLTTMLEASGDHGPDYVLYADELELVTDSELTTREKHYPDLHVTQSEDGRLRIQEVE